MALAYSSDQYERPVVILNRFGVPTAVSSAMEAYMFLTDWPISRRDAAHAIVMKGCLAALRDEVEIDTARGLFASWAELHDILAPDVAAFVTSQRGSSHGAR
ncbi:DUF982 domain-containing protein [Bosea sp. 124]|uniref:DUF982 domain-containing protein n=1 Tax=Bosea sp. 124 TaxID=2135642 RepID=UPI000D34F9DD|nr:DUF982 domain-containing protein [Bosea sp. 124]PTM39467.1 uncharacterized protein DUF982 [Bosea sp. 124]